MFTGNSRPNVIPARPLAGLVLALFWVALSPANAHADGLCGICDSSQTVLSRISPPEGFARVDVEEGSFAWWLRRLHLLPDGEDAVDWRGNRVFGPDDVAGVLDWRLLGEVEQCADVAIRLVSEFARRNGHHNKLEFGSLSLQSMGFREWQRGRYSLTPDGSFLIYHPGDNRPDTRATFDDYLRFVMTYANTASLRRDWPGVGSAEIGIGDVLIQPGCPGTGMGHLSVVIDVCESPGGQRLFLFMDGYTPARVPVIRQLEPGNAASAWMTDEEYQGLLSQFGVGEFYRTPPIE